MHKAVLPVVVSVSALLALVVAGYALSAWLGHPSAPPGGAAPSATGASETQTATGIGLPPLPVTTPSAGGAGGQAGGGGSSGGAAGGGSGATSSPTSANSASSSASTSSSSTSASGTPTLTSTPTVPPLAPPAQVTGACTVALAGFQGNPFPPTSGACSPATFVSSTGAPFTSIAVQVTETAQTLPSTATVQVKDAAGNVLATGYGLGPLHFTVPAAEVPSTPSVPLTATVSLGGVFVDYSATMAFTLS